MKVDIIIYDDEGCVAYEQSRDMEFIPNIGEGILMDLDDDLGWISGKYYCEYATCYKKYNVFNGGLTSYFVCEFRGYHWHTIL